MRALFGLEDYYGDGAVSASSMVDLDLTFDDVASAAFIPAYQASPVFNVSPPPYVQVPAGLLESYADIGVPILLDGAVGGNYTPVELPGGFDTSANLFDFGFEVDAGGNPDLEALIPLVIEIATAAFSNIAAFINGDAAANIDVAISLVQQGPGIVASAGAGALFFGDVVNGVQELVTGTQIELQTGIDPNGAEADIVVNINTDFLLSASAFLSTDPNRVVPAGALDYVTVLTHELFHGLGFFSFRDNSGAPALADFDGDGTLEEFESTYGLNVSFDGNLQPSYDGDNVVDVYGEAINLESTFDSAGSDVSHFAAFNRDGTITDTALTLMNPSIVNGDVTIIGALELAVLEDLGYDISAPADLQLLNDLDGLPFTPTISVNPNLTVADGAASISVELDAATLFISIPTSVGVEISAADGTIQTLRARISPEDLSTAIELDDAMLRALAEDGATSVSVRLFYPAQAVLANGDVEQIVNVPLDALFGVGGSGNDFYDGTVATVGFGDAGNDTILGSSFDDIFFGEGDDDILAGRGGDDRLVGGEGEDTLAGGIGNDLLEGGSGADTFVFGEGYGTDIVLDFEDGIDTLALADFTEAEALAAFNARTGDANSVTLDFGNGDVLTLIGIGINDLGPEDVILNFDDTGA